MTTYTKKFKEFLQEWNPEDDDYVVGYRSLDDSEIRIPLVAIDNSITANKYIRKDIDDYANGIIKFNKGFTVSSNVMSTIYLQGLTGWMGTQEGDFEMNSLILREFLEVPELRKNKITVMGNQFWFTDSAMVKEVTATGSGNYDIYFKLEEEEYAPFELNDILKGIYHYSNGFWTCYLKVYELILDPDTQGEIGIKVHSMNDRDPRKSMLLARINNSDDPERQGSIFADGLRRYIRVLYGYDENDPTSEGSIDTLKVQMGDLSTITNHPIFGNLEGYGLYADNVYLTGRLVVKNDPNQPGQELGVYRGVWNAETNYYKYDQVTYNGSLYTSKQVDNIGNIPNGGIDDLWWELTVSKGDAGQSGIASVMMELTNDNHLIPTDSEGKNPVYGGAFCTAYVYQGTTDITDVFTITASVQAPVTEDQLQFVQNENTVTITYISDDIDNAAIKFTATAEGYPTVEKIWNISKSKSGIDGQSPTAYWIVTDTPVIKKHVYNIDGVETIKYEPSPFVVRAFSQTGNEDIKQCDGYFKIIYGLETQVIAGSVYQFIPEADVLNYTIEFYIDKELTTLVDKEIVTVVSDGTVPNWQTYIFKASETIPDTPTYKMVPTDFPTPEGWVDYPLDSVSIWWMSTATINGVTNMVYEWSKPVKVTGEDGQDGIWVDFKFAKNTDCNIAPPLIITDRYPDGWSDTTPAIESGEYLWMTNATINPDNTLKTNWSNPVRISGEQGPQGEPGPQGPQGLHGEDGLQGPSIVFAGNWDPNRQYYGYADTQTCVYYNGVYYYTKTVSPELSPIIIPSGDENHPASDTGKIYWNEFVGQFDNIATGLLLAERIATSELTANKLFIVDREESSGNIIAADGSIITKEEEANLDPNEIIGRLTQGWYLDQGVIRSIAVDDNLQPILKMDKDGRITATGVTVTGTVHFQNGTIGNMTVYGDTGWQSSVNGPYPASTGYYYLRKENGVTITPEGHIIGKDYFLTGDSSVGPSVFIGDVYVPGSSVPGTDDNSLTSFLKLFNTLFERVLIGEQYFIKAKLPLFSVGEITAYGNDGMEVSSLWEGIPVDKVTIDLIDGKLTVIGGTGGIKSIILPAMTEEDALVGATLDNKGEIITFTKGTFATKDYVDSHIPTSIAWSAITNKPTTLSGYGITDGVNTINVTGNGNAITSASISGHTITLNKDNTFLLSAEYTASDILTKLKTVDGANSGLDADTIDGKHLTDILNSNVASATKLANARTLWGQSFDGTANVSGNMTGVGSITATGAISTSSYIQIGKGRIYWDETNNALYVKYNDGSSAINFYSLGEITAYGSSSMSGGGGTNYDRLDDWSDYTSSKDGYVLSAKLGWDLNTRVEDLEAGSALSITTTGSGNVITGISKSGTVITATKGITAITRWPSFSEVTSKPTTLSGYGITDGVNTVSVTGSGNAVTAASISGHTLTLTKGNTFLLSSAYTASDILTKLKTVDGSGSGLDADTLDGYHVSSILKRSSIDITSGETIDVEEYTKTNSLTREAGNIFSVDRWAWANSAHIKLTDDISLDRMRYSIISYRNGNLNSIWQQQALLFLPTYTDSKMIYLAQMNTNEIAGNVSKAIRRYADYDTILSSNVASATKLQTPRTIWGQSFDGQQNVSGDMTGVGQIIFSNNGKIQCNSEDFIGFSNRAGNAALPIKAYSLILADYFKTSSYRLYVDGTFYASGAATLNDTLSVASTSTFGGAIRANGSYLFITDTAGGNGIYLSKGSISVHSNYSYTKSVMAVDLTTGGTTFANLITATSGLTTPQYIQIGNGRIYWDSTNKALYVKGSDGSAINFYSTGEITAYGSSSSSGGGGGVDYDRLDDWSDYTSGKAGYVLSAGLGYDLHTRVQSLEAGSALSITTTGSGNAITSITKSGTTITATKGSTFSLSGHNHSYLPYQDTRGIEYTPYDTDFAKKGLSATHLKLSTTDGLSDGGIFHTSLYLHPWGDSSGGAAHNLAFTDNGNIWIRSGTSSWGSWKRILSTGNYTSTLDTRYVNKSGDTMTGKLSFNVSTNQIISLLSSQSESSISYQSSNSTYNAKWIVGKGSWGTGNNFTWGIDGGTSLTTGAKMQLTPSGELLILGNKVWHAGNDGSGSGLDADLLDGTHKANLFESLATSSSINLLVTIGGTTKMINDLYATTAEKLSTTSAGSTTRPVYFANGIPVAGTYTFGNASGNAAISNGTVCTNLNADLLDGYNYSSFESCKLVTIDASSLDENTWYPVTMSIGNSQQTRIRIEGNTKADASWNGRTDKLMSLILDYTVNGSFWGWTSVSRTIYRYIEGAGTSSCLGGLGQLTNSSTEYVFVRGGAKYNFYVSRFIIPTLRTSTYTISDQSVSPTTTKPTIISVNNALTTSNVASATKLQTARTIWGQSFDGTDNVSGILTGWIGNAENWTDTWSDGTNSHPWYGYDHRYVNTGVYSSTISDYAGICLRTAYGYLVMNSAGSVGIGTTSPSYKLHVDGAIYASSVAVLGSTLSVSGTSTFTGRTTHNGGLASTTGTFSSTLAVTGATTLSSTLNVASTLTAAAGIVTDYDAGMWITMATRSNIIRGNQNQVTNGAHALYRVKNSNGDAIVFGGLGVNTGFYGFTASKISSNENNYDWFTTWNVQTGALTHNKTLSVSGAVTFGSTLTVTSTTTLKGGLSVTGNIVATGEITAYSDVRLKSNIEPLVYRGRLNPKSYIKDGKQSIGFIAQDVQELYPELVMETGGDNNYLSLNYGNITAVLSAQINIVEDEVTILKRRVKELEAEIEILKKS